MSVADQDRQAEERRREALKIQFELLKHRTTLGGATALVEIALYESVEVDTGALALSLVMLALCVGGSMFTIVDASGKMQSGESPGSAEAYLSGAYLSGLGLFALTAVGLSLEVALAIVFLANLGLVVVSQVMIWRLSRRRWPWRSGLT